MAELSEDALSRLADIVELQPTKNSELQERWGMDSGSEVHQYLESELEEFYFRDDNSLIRATPEAAELVDVEPGVVVDTDGTVSIRIPRLQAQILYVLAGPGEHSQSIVSILHALREEYDVDPSTDEIREALGALRRKDVVEVVQRTVPTYRRTVETDAMSVSVTEESGQATA